MNKLIVAALVVANLIVVCGIARADVSTCSVDAKGNFVGCSAPVAPHVAPAKIVKPSIKGAVKSAHVAS
jgi:hypothetical protein